MARLYCHDCGDFLNDDELVGIAEPHGEVLMHCPGGEGHHIGDVQECAECGEECPSDEIVDGTDYCPPCHDSLEAAGEFE